MDVSIQTPWFISQRARPNIRLPSFLQHTTHTPPHPHTPTTATKLPTTAANIIYKVGQPALLYIVPSLILTSLATGAFTGQGEDMWAFGVQEGEGGGEREA